MTILHFDRAELERRRGEACASMARQGMDGLLLFRQESMYYLTGYDTSGYTMFQALLLTQDGECALLTRPIDLIQAQRTSVIEDIRIWRDGDEAAPGRELRPLLKDYNLQNKVLGVEYHAYCLTGQRAKMVEEELGGYCKLSDASTLVRSLQLVKSESELHYIKKAGSLCDRIIELSIGRCRPGVSVKAIYGEMIETLMREGGDPPASRWPMGAGKAALFARYYTGENIIGNPDHVCFEPGAAFRHYHACAMYNVVVGHADPKLRDMCRVCCGALDACQDALKPGRTIGEIFEVHRRIFDEEGYGKYTMSACGYTMGAMYPPTWMDWPMFWAESPQIIERGMVFFLHMILFDRDKGLSMSIGETTIVRDEGVERVSHVPRRLIEVEAT